MKKITLGTAQKAVEYFEKGYNCCESVFHACCEDLGIELSEQSKKIATGFGAGMGRGCTCGAMSAGVMTISLLKGRVKPLDEDKAPACDLAKDFSNQFKEKFRTTCCSSLKKGNDRKHCETYVSGVVEILSTML